jgi:GNAT superfamily N-acetyltransferase
MKSENPILPVGYSPLARGQIANAVTYLEMTAKPRPRPAQMPTGPVELRPMARDDIDTYRALFRRVGENWLWFSRLAMSDAELSGLLQDPLVEAYALTRNRNPIGLLELDFRQPEECELAYFGLAREAIGHGLGRYLMDWAIARAWAQPIRRFWLHTCTFDHPSAIGFYRRCGFQPYAFAVEVLDDPRLSGLLPRTAAGHVPLIEP